MTNHKEQQTSRAGRPSSLLILLPMLVAALAMYGCGSDPISSTADQGTAVNLSQAPSVEVVAKHEKCSEVSGWVTVEDGGSIDLGLKGNGGVLEVAPGAASADALVSVSVCRNNHPHGGDYEFIELEFLPDGVTFSPAATLTIKAASLNRIKEGNGKLKVIKLYYLNEDTGEWEVVNEAPVKKGKVEFKLDHFSKYGISS